jgi:hypothetical protein
MKDILTEIKSRVNAIIVQDSNQLILDINRILDEYIVEHTISPNDIKMQSDRFGYYN